MGDHATSASSALPPAVLRSLVDKLYDKRKAAALEVERMVKQLAEEGNHERISAILQLLASDHFAQSPQVNNRKGGLIGLAAATVGLGQNAGHHLESIVPNVLRSFSDPDSRVRYYACEALYNIAKVSRADIIVFFNDIFDALCKLSADSDPGVQNAAHLLDRLVKDIVTGGEQFSIEEFIPLLKERMNVLNPFVQQFLVGWISVLESVPDIDMLGFLPDFLDGLFNMLGDSAYEIRGQADSALREFLEEIKYSNSVEFGRMTEILVQRTTAPDEFTRLTAVTWINEFVKLAGPSLTSYYAAILGAVLPCIADPEDRVQSVAKETNEELLARLAPKATPEGIEIAALLDVTRREVGSEWEATKLEALRWILTLLNKFPQEVLPILGQPDSPVLHAILSALDDASNFVAMAALEVMAEIAKHPEQFNRLLLLLLLRFNADRSLLERRGSLALRHLAAQLDTERVFREIAGILQNESDLEFAAIMVQALNLILLSAPELIDLRRKLRAAFSGFSMATPLSGPMPPVPSAASAASSASAAAAVGSGSAVIGGSGGGLFTALFPAWCHTPIAAVSLCLLSQAYDLAGGIILSLQEADISVSFLVQLDKLVHLLETPIFAQLRLQLLEPSRNAGLLRALYGLLMLLPQHSQAFKILKMRLKSVPTNALLHLPSSSAFHHSTAAFSHQLQHQHHQQQQQQLRHSQSLQHSHHYQQQVQQMNSQQHPELASLSSWLPLNTSLSANDSEQREATTAAPADGSEQSLESALASEAPFRSLSWNPSLLSSNPSQETEEALLLRQFSVIQRRHRDFRQNMLRMHRRTFSTTTAMSSNASSQALVSEGEASHQTAMFRSGPPSIIGSDSHEHA